MVCINFSAHFQFAHRLEYAMLREIVGLGPLRHCIVYQDDFLSILELAIVMTYLPRQKMFIYPAGTNLTRHFSQGRRAIWARVLMRQPLLTQGEFNANFGH